MQSPSTSASVVSSSSSLTRSLDKDVCSSAMKSYQHLISPPPSPLSPSLLSDNGDVIRCSRATTPSKQTVSTSTLRSTSSPGARLTSQVCKGYQNSPRAWLLRERLWLRRHLPDVAPISSPAKRPRRMASTISTTVETKVAADNPRASPDFSDSRPSTPVSSSSRSHYYSKSTTTRFKQSSREFSSSSQVLDVANTPYEMLPDYSPDMSILDKKAQPRPLRSEWKGPPLDLSNDEHRQLLHPAELQLAATLRLPCLIYLDNKRRIFAEWHNRRSEGLSFRKTDAQRASRVDVNKASRLWKAFHDEGFFDN
ncbi:clr6 L associated factor 1 Laf1 [Schizosaccharomyces cryophilus OY26]|uniref:Clr6 L associated factor 1 Laf1 n=1 Tax=Schizosaccharomyces cryophilus (strain OY26 / ATCC MYA-4695 / CBS 11777 / NBRC 106824 / NRRL Y48691) TaxID=653667 RepID=S9WZN7_SCHCR|nr:clr6 L associated factor 1 Laf1 [Schizosaccharomyces cryophilus OY26]EPY50187.1 clr6 L associated factor 1 Laf1 [Schizosaccharomyces cryophilus OY26]